jgi:diaminopimelate decarboxylase
MAAFYPHLWSFQRTEVFEQSFRLCGPLCMEDDVLSGAMTSPLPEAGSLVATLNAGAYSMSLSREFAQPLPPVLGLTPHGDLQPLRTRGQFPSSHEISL